MPKIEYNQTIEISPERFLNACSAAELFDIDRLIQQPRYQNKIEEMMTGVISEHAEVVTDQISPAQAKIAGRAISKYCIVCGKPKHLVLYNQRLVCEACIIAIGGGLSGETFSTRL